MKDYCFIINPASKGGRNKRFLAGLKAWIQMNLPEAIFKETKSPGHATQLAIQAGKEGFKNCIAIGGDGTLHEVVNGIVLLGTDYRPRVGFIAVGTGGDFARQMKEQFGLSSRDYEWLRNPKEVSVDVGKAVLKRKDQSPLTKYFINIASVGISGEVTRRVNLSKKRLGALEYLRATLLAGLKYKSSRVRITGLDHDQAVFTEEFELLLLVVANSRYFGGGMCIAPDAKINDGKFQILVSEKASFFSLLAQIPLLYRGKHLMHPKVHYAHGDHLSIEALQGDMPIDLDGEFYQAQAVEFEVIPNAVKLLVGKTKYRQS